MTRLRLYDKDMNEIILRGVKWLEFIPAPIEAEKFTEKVGNREIDLGKTTGARSIDAKLWFKAADEPDFALLRNELYAMLSPLKEMWVVDSKVPGVKWWVEVDGLSKPKRINGRVAEFDVVFRSLTTYSRSIGNSLEPYTMASGLWSYGMGLVSEESMQDYIHSGTEFTIYNAGNVLIDPREHELEIKLTYSGSVSSNVIIRNESTGDEWKYTGSLANGQTIILSGVKATKNGVNIVGNTNFGLITLAKGLNEIHIIGLNGNFEIQFKFPFLYV